MNECTLCGKHVPENSAFCTGCGTRTSTDSNTASTHRVDSHKSSPAPAVHFIVGSVLSVVASLVILARMTIDTQWPSSTLMGESDIHDAAIHHWAYLLIPSVIAGAIQFGLAKRGR